MIKYVKGNLFDSKAKVLAHGVNCKGAFGAGVAKQMAIHFPQAKAAYLDKYRKEGWILGEVQIVEIVPKGTITLDYAVTKQKDGTWVKNEFRKVANCATQQGYGYKNGQTVYVDYGAIAICFKRLIQYCEYAHCDLTMPQIGAGLAGGDWEIIKSILETTAEDSNVDITVYSLG